MSDLIALMSQLVDNKGKLLVPGIYDTVAKLTPEEEKLYDAIEFDMVRHLFRLSITVQLGEILDPPQSRWEKSWIRHSLGGRNPGSAIA